MGLVRNLGGADRILRVLIGALLGFLAVLVRSHIYGATLLALGSLILVVEGAIGH